MACALRAMESPIQVYKPSTTNTYQNDGKFLVRYRKTLCIIPPRN
ncbi:MAG: hypothetical protein P8X89_21565 [Reinekea sp.]